jgi:hypothetical protein
MMTEEQLKECRMSDGSLRAFTMVGSYPVFYLDTSDNVLCRNCAESELEWDCDDSGLGGYGINYEDPHLHCDECNERIESAYAEDEEESIGD